MGRKWTKERVTLGELRFFPATEEGSYPLSGRLECLDCDPQVTLLFHHAGLEENLSALEMYADRPVPLDRQHKYNWVLLGPSLTPEGSAWSEPQGLFGCCVALLSPPQKSPYGYEFEAHLKPEGPHESIAVQFTHEEYPHHFFVAVTFQADTAILVDCGTPYAQRFMTRGQFEDEVAGWQQFGEMLARRDRPPSRG